MFDTENESNSDPYIQARQAIDAREGAKNFRRAQKFEATATRQPHVLTDAGPEPGPEATPAEREAYEIRKRLVDGQVDIGKLPVVRVRGIRR